MVRFCFENARTESHASCARRLEIYFELRAFPEFTAGTAYEGIPLRKTGKIGEEVGHGETVLSVSEIYEGIIFLILRQGIFLDMNVPYNCSRVELYRKVSQR